MELVVLVNENDQDIGRAEKDAVHTTTTRLHRGFSLFLFNQTWEVMLTQRSRWKKAFPDIWTNTVCGHPRPDETAVAAAQRRLKEELGMVATTIEEVAPYRYQFTDQNGIMENEICPILVGRSYAYPKPNLNEVQDWKWLPWRVFLREIEETPESFSPWCREEAKIIEDKLQILKGL